MNNNHSPGNKIGNKLLTGIGIIVVWLLFGGIVYIFTGGNLKWALEITGLIAAIAILNEVSKDKSKSNSKGSASPYKDSLQYPPDWDEITRVVRARDGYRCGNCGSNSNLHVHHIVPLSKGGSNAPGNLRTLCEDCHKKLHPHMRD